jgi:hypothetical protein
MPLRPQESQKVYGIRVGTARAARPACAKTTILAQITLPWIDDIGSLPWFEKE